MIRISGQSPPIIIADDLTGAADSASCFLNGKYNVKIKLLAGRPLVSPQPGTILAYDTETRDLSLGDAIRKLTALKSGFETLLGPKSGIARIYKKVDSGLNGHVGAEIEYLLHVTGRNKSLLAPSNPAYGKAVVEGCLHVARDHSGKSADGLKVADILRKTTCLPVVEVHIEQIQQGPEYVRSVLDSVAEGIVVCDATDNAHLEIIAQTISFSHDVLPSGSAGLMRFLTKFWTAGDKFKADHVFVDSGQCDIAIAVGSLNHMSQMQMNHLTSKLGLPVTEVGSDNHQADSLSICLPAAQSNFPGVKVFSLKESTEYAGSYIERLPLLGEAVLHWARSLNTSRDLGVIATGGATAAAFCTAAGIDEITLVEEIEPGVVRGFAPSAWRERLWMILKPGGAGQVQTLTNIVQKHIGNRGGNH